MPLTQVQLSAALADRAEISRAEAKRVLGALEEVVLQELGNAQKVRIGGLVQLTVRVKPAQKARMGRNPRRARRSRSRPSRRVSMCGRVPWRRPRRGCPACRKPAGGWLRRSPDKALGADQAASQSRTLCEPPAWRTGAGSRDGRAAA